MKGNKILKRILSFVLVCTLVFSTGITYKTTYAAQGDKVSAFSYDFAYNTPGYAEGTIRISASEDGVYKVFWGDENGDKLKKNGHLYTYLCRVVVQNGEGSFNIATGHTAIPQGAKKVLVYRKDNLEYTYNLPSDRLFDEEDGYSFASLSDPHFERYFTFSDDDSAVAMNEAVDFLHGEGIKFVGVCGDLSSKGEHSAFEKYNTIANKYPDMTVLTVTGNHDTRTTASTSDGNKLITQCEDFYNTIFKDYYTVDGEGNVNNKLNVPILANDALSNPVPVEYRATAGGEILNKSLPGFDFVTEAGGNIFIFLNEIAKTGEVYDTDKLITTGQMDWLQEQLETYRDKNVFIYFHSFLPVNTNNNDAVDFNNCVGDLKNAGGYSYDLDYKDVVKTSDGLNLQALLSKYKNSAMFTGHSHWQYAAQDINPCLNIGTLRGGEGGTLLHVASVGAPRYIGDNDTIRVDMNGYMSEGTIVTTYDDCIVYESAEFVNGEYEAYATYMVPTANSDKYKPVKNPSYQKSTTAITGTDYMELDDLMELQVPGSQYNLTLGAGYQYTSKGTENKDTALTDGKATGDFYASKAGKSTTQSVYITLDGLQDVSNINRYSVHFVSGITNADTLSVELSEDGENYQPAGYYTNHKYTDMALEPDLSQVTIEKFKYVRLNLISGGKAYGYQIKEFAVVGNEKNQIPNTAGSASSLIDGVIDEEDYIDTDYNMVYCADYTQSSTGSENKDGALTDGSMNGFMNTERNSSAKNQNIVIDVGIGRALDVSNIDYFLLYSQNEITNVTAFDVSVSLDGENYESIGTYRNVAIDDNHFDADLSNVTLEKFRFVKLHLSNGNTGYGYQVKEFAVIGFDPVVIPKPDSQAGLVADASKNYALRKNVWVTSTYSKEGTDPTVLTDGNLSKYWSSDWDSTRKFDDIVIDFGEEVDADRIGSFVINFKSNNTFCKNVEFLVSDSFDEENPDEGFVKIGGMKAANWEALMKRSDDNGYSVCEIPQYTGLGDVRYAKIHMNGHENWGFQVKEVAVIKCAKKNPDGSQEEETTTVKPTTTVAPTTKAPTTVAPTKVAPTTKAPTTVEPTDKPTAAPTAAPTKAVTPTKKPAVTVGKAAVKKATKKKSAKKLKVTLKRVNGASGYQVKVFKTKKIKKALATKNVTNLKFTLKSKKFKNKKKLYVRARAFVFDAGTKVYGIWSGAKKVKIK